MANRHETLKKMVTSSALAAISVILTWVEIQIGAAGGSINLVMLPIIISGYLYGLGWGIGTGLVVGFIKCLIGGGIGWGLPSILLDYVLAYGAVGMAGFFKSKKWGLELGAVVACISRFAVHFISGITIYKILVPTAIEGTNLVIANPVIFSIVYNGLYMIPSSIIVIILTFIIKKPIEKYVLKK